MDELDAAARGVVPGCPKGFGATDPLKLGGGGCRLPATFVVGAGA